MVSGPKFAPQRINNCSVSGCLAESWENAIATKMEVVTPINAYVTTGGAGEPVFAEEDVILAGALVSVVPERTGAPPKIDLP